MLVIVFFMSWCILGGKIPELGIGLFFLGILDYLLVCHLLDLNKK